MWFEIVLSICAGWFLGLVSYTKFEKARALLAYYFPSLQKKKSRSLPAVYCSQPRPSDEISKYALQCNHDPDDIIADYAFQSKDSGMAKLMQAMSSSTKEDSFEDKVKNFEEKHGSKVVFINHGRRETTVMGIDLNFTGSNDTLCTNDAQKLLDILRGAPDDDLDIILHTTGGSMAAAEVMVKALLAHKGEIRVHIPYYAQSAGTLLALVGDEIHLGYGGWLTQVDPQLCYISAATLLEYTSNVDTQMRTWFSDIAALGRVGAKKAMDRALELMENICKARKHTSGERDHLTDLFVRGYSNHDKPLTAELLTDVPHLSIGVDDEVMELYRAHCKNR